MKKFSLALLLAINLFAAEPIKSTVEELSWPSGDTFLTFLEKNSIPLALYYDLDSEDKEFVSEIKAGISYQILRGEDGAIKQVLIPINEELQVQIYKDEEGKFKFQLSSISYQVYKRVLSMPVSANPSQDILEATGSAALAHGFYLAMRSEVGAKEFTKLKKGDRLAMEYTQKMRLGRTFGAPEIHWAMIEIGGKKYTVYKYENKYYDKSGKKNDKFLLTRPIANARITSPFTPKRYHPILKRYKAHLGVDYGAPKGTPIKAAGEGTVKFVGTKSGYGKVVILGHAGGYETLYAHTSGFAKGIKSGVKVKQGQLIAYVGNTGMSTGSHLHFGVYKNGNAINPETEIKVAKSVFAINENAKFQKYVKQFETKIKEYASKDEIPEREQRFDAAMDWRYPTAELKADVNLTATDANLTAVSADANLTAREQNKTEQNLTKIEPSKTDANLTAPSKEANLTQSANRAGDKNTTEPEANLAGKTDVNLTQENRPQDKKETNQASEANASEKAEANLTDTNLSVKGESNLTAKKDANLTAKPKAETNSSATKTDENASDATKTAANLAAAKTAKSEPKKEKAGKTQTKAKLGKDANKTKQNSAAKNDKNKDQKKPKTADKKKEKSSQKAKNESKKKDSNATKDKPKKQKDASADKKAKLKNTADATDKKSK